MSEIFYSDEMKKFEQEQFLKKSSYLFMQKAGDQIFKFINNNFKNNSSKIVLCVSPLLFNIFIPSTTINFFTDNYTIPESNWIITILIGNRD